MRVAIVENGPRYSTGALGLGSKRSRWLGPPPSQTSRIDLALLTSAPFEEARALAANAKGAVTPAERNARRLRPWQVRDRKLPTSTVPIVRLGVGLSGGFGDSRYHIRPGTQPRAKSYRREGLPSRRGEFTRYPRSIGSVSIRRARIGMQTPRRLITKVRCTVWDQTAAGAAHADLEVIMRIYRLLIWILALMLNATGSATEGEPEDPYEWLEDVSGAKPLTWAKERNAETVKELTRSADFQTLERRVLQILDSEDRIPIVQKLGPNFYNFWRDGKNPRGVWRRTTLDEYKKTKPTWEIVLDLDRLGEEEKENWLWHGAQVLKPDYQRALVSLSRGGADASVVREFDLTGKAFVSDGFRLAEAKSQVALARSGLRVRGHGFRPGLAYRVGLSSHRQGMEEGYAAGRGGADRGRSAERYERFRHAGPHARFRAGHRGAAADVLDIRGFPTAWRKARSYRQTGRFCGLAGTRVVTFAAAIRVAGRRQDLSGRCSHRGRSREVPGRSREFETLFEPDERRSLASFTATRNFVLVTELDNVRSRVYVLDHRDGSWHREPLPGVPDFGDVSVQAIDPDLSDDYFLHLNDFLTPNTLALGTIGSGPAIKLKQLPAFFDADSLTVSQHEAVSRTVPEFRTSRSPVRISRRMAKTRPCCTGTVVSRSQCFRLIDLPSGPPGSRKGECSSWPTFVAGESSAQSGISRR